LNVGTGIPPRTGNGCASEVSRFIAVFDNQPMPLGDTARIGDEGKAAEPIAPAALLSGFPSAPPHGFKKAGSQSEQVCCAWHIPLPNCHRPGCPQSHELRSSAFESLTLPTMSTSRFDPKPDFNWHPYALTAATGVAFAFVLSILGAWFIP